MPGSSPTSCAANIKIEPAAQSTASPSFQSVGERSADAASMRFGGGSVDGNNAADSGADDDDGDRSNGDDVDATSVLGIGKHLDHAIDRFVEVALLVCSLF